jgi:hypothetical protein
MTDTPSLEILPVEQRHRDAAADYMAAVSVLRGAYDPVAMAFMDPICDELPIVQAFARFERDFLAHPFDAHALANHQDFGGTSEAGFSGYYETDPDAPVIPADDARQCETCGGVGFLENADERKFECPQYSGRGSYTPKAPAHAAAGDVVERLPCAADAHQHYLAALNIGERFLNKCNSAWAAGEPRHRVRDMLDAANEFRKALDNLSTIPGLDGRREEAKLPTLLEWILELARRDILREQTDFVGRMHQAMGGFEAVCDDHPDGDLPEDARDDAGENLAALAGLALAQLAMVSNPEDPLTALKSTEAQHAQHD